MMEQKSRIPRAFGEVLRELRTEKRFSQEALATESDLDRKFVYLPERGQRQPSFTTIFKLAKALKISPNKIVKRVEKKMGKNFIRR